MCVEISPRSTTRLVYRRAISYPCKRNASSHHNSFSSSQQLSAEEPAYKKTTFHHHDHPSILCRQEQKSSSLQQQQQPSSKRRRKHQHRHRVTFSTNSSLHIVTNLTIHHKTTLWLTSEQIQHTKRKVELFTYLLKSNRLDRNEFDKEVLMGLEKHLYHEEEEEEEEDVSDAIAVTKNDGARGSSSSSSSATTSGGGGGGTSSSQRQELFTAVLQEQQRQLHHGIQDVEALAMVSREKSQRARDLARMIGILQSL